MALHFVTVKCAFVRFFFSLFQIFCDEQMLWNPPQTKERVKTILTQGLDTSTLDPACVWQICTCFCLGFCFVFFQCVMAVFTCMGSHMSSQVAGLAETLPTLIAEILSLPHERPQHPCAHTNTWGRKHRIKWWLCKFQRSKPLQAILDLEEAKCSEFELLILRTEIKQQHISIYLSI